MIVPQTEQTFQTNNAFAHFSARSCRQYAALSQRVEFRSGGSRDGAGGFFGIDQMSKPKSLRTDFAYSYRYHSP
jgi:hypothetical protein